ncbi:unnamed protein product [Paramecium octaurelia]|uniref:Uncharacterized protein n=1 Tax=Paramecium octaurelia TaxID=43137 RepID=A0A8S1TBG3_PAROT|nr:unnamed protein product [Paramecium octaurelia]
MQDKLFNRMRIQKQENKTFMIQKTRKNNMLLQYSLHLS